MPAVLTTLRSRRFAAGVVALAVPLSLLAACGDDDDATPVDDATTTTGQEHGCAVAEGGEVTIVAKDLAWDVECIQAPEDVPLRITVDNRDDGVNHNLHLTGAPGSPTTPLEAGPVAQTLEVGGDLPAGRYEYVCDIHPTMTGELEILEPPLS